MTDVMDDDLREPGGDSVGPVQGIAPWNRPENNDSQRHRLLNGKSYKALEWLPKPVYGRTLPLSTRHTTDGPVYVQIVPGPGGLYQIVRVDLSTPVARGFPSPEAARKWLGFALKGGILPRGVVELEGEAP